MGRFTGDQVIAHPTLAVYTEESPIINADAIASHLELGMQPPLLPQADHPPWSLVCCHLIQTIRWFFHFCRLNKDYILRVYLDIAKESDAILSPNWW